MAQSRGIILGSILACVLLGTCPAAAQKKYDPGVSDTEIKLGNIMPYSGPLSAYALIGRTQDAFFKRLNAEGGINGRKVNFVSYDDSFSPAKTVEQARKLVESDEVLLIFQSLGTPTNLAIQKYMNAKKVPQLFVATGATKFGDPKNFPWTMGWQPTYQTEGRIYAKYLLQNHRDAKIAVLYQNDDSGKDYLKDPTDPTWRNDPATKEWEAFIDKYLPGADKTSTFTVYGYLLAQTMVDVLKRCGDDLTRENIMKQAANMDLQLGMLLPGIRIKTGASDYFPIEQMQMTRVNGQYTELFGPVLSGELGGS